MSDLFKEHTQYSLGSLAKRIKAYKTGNYFDLGPFFKNNEEAPVFPGDLVLVVGDSGAGKTAFMQNICLQSEMPTMYVSPEVSPALMMRRNMQILSGENKWYIYDHYRDVAKGYKEQLNKFYTIGYGINQDTIEEEYKKACEQINVKHIVLDHMKIMDFDFREIRGNLENFVVDLKKFAVNNDVIIWMVSQVTKNASSKNFYKTKSKEIQITDAAEASGLYQIANVGMTISLPNGKNNPARVVSVKKGRDIDASKFERIPFIQDRRNFRYIPNNDLHEKRQEYVNDIAQRQQKTTMFERT